MRKTDIFILLSILFIAGSCNDKDEVILDTPKAEPEVIGPIFISEIEGGFWQNSNHTQGICFTDNSLIVSCTKQLIKWNFDLNGVVDERRCSYISAGCGDNFHYGDVATGVGDLWVAYHEGDWESNINCNLNRVARFENEIINEQYTPLIYYVDYQGHIGAIEVIGDKLYISGKYIPVSYNGEECFNPLIIYVYDIDDLVEPPTCNVHENVIAVNQNGRWGVQAMSSSNDGSLVVAPYKCPNDENSFVYKVSLTDGFFTTSIFANENWGYGFDIKENGGIYFCEDNRNEEVFYVREYEN